MSLVTVTLGRGFNNYFKCLLWIILHWGGPFESRQAGFLDVSSEKSAALSYNMEPDRPDGTFRGIYFTCSPRQRVDEMFGRRRTLNKKNPSGATW